ncbi:MAG: bifunctional DNA primase/polymerase [Nitrospira sp.]
MPVLKTKKGSECLAAALVYGDMGWRVHPLHGMTKDGRCTCGNSECKSPGKHPRLNMWQDYASCDRATIRSWWKQWPNSNVGIVTGAASGIVVLDIDGPDGEENVKSLNLPVTFEVKTRRGRHLYFLHPGYPVKNRIGMQPGLDLKGEGGYVVAPPSKHVAGEYEWIM